MRVRILNFKYQVASRGEILVKCAPANTVKYLPFATISNLIVGHGPASDSANRIEKLVNGTETRTILKENQGDEELTRREYFLICLGELQPFLFLSASDSISI